MGRGGTCALALAVSIAVVPSVAARSNKKNHEKPASFSKQIPKQEKVLHALRRLTFGPRPGDVERVKTIGLKKWIDEQLHPETIPENPVLEAKLAPLDSLRLNSEDLVKDYPPPQLIRQMAMGRIPFPTDPVRQRMIRHLAERYEKRLKKDAAPEEPPAKVMARLLAPGQQRVLRSGTPEQKLRLVSSLPDGKLYPILEATPQNVRYALFAVAPPELQHKIRTTLEPQAVVVQDLTESKLYRAVYSNRQLEQVLDDFWYNHFNVYLDKGVDRYLITEYERDVIRPHVLGKFKDLLLATAKSPAMLYYLDNWQSSAPQTSIRGKRFGRGLNENYGRELMELHTLGVDGGYTQKDVIAVARCFTGWTIRSPERGGGFEYNDRMHDKGEKVVLGVTIPAGGGMDDGLKVLDILAHHPSTARFISKKLAIRFVADNPPKSLIDKMAKTFTKTDGDIREVLKTMLNSKEFWSQGAYQAKVKSPFEMVASAVRALDADVNSGISASYVLAQMGEPLYRKEEPTGYSSTNAAWMNSAALLSRMNFALGLVTNRIPGIHVDLAKLGVTSPDDPMQVAKALSLMDISAQTRTAIAETLKQKEKAPPALAGLILGSPEFQRK
jgi:uncharacterized protein (DUF1800 family)